MRDKLFSITTGAGLAPIVGRLSSRYAWSGDIEEAHMDERRSKTDRRKREDRRTETDRRRNESVAGPNDAERRSVADRRERERRNGVDRRGESHSTDDD